MPSILSSISQAEVHMKAGPQLAKLRQATDGLESYMFKTLLSSVKKESGGLFGKNTPGKDIYQDMFEQTMSDSMAKRGSLGISQILFERVAPMAIANEEVRLRQEAAPTVSPETGVKSS